MSHNIAFLFRKRSEKNGAHTSRRNQKKKKRLPISQYISFARVFTLCLFFGLRRLYFFLSPIATDTDGMSELNNLESKGERKWSAGARESGVPELEKNRSKSDVVVAYRIV